MKRIYVVFTDEEHRALKKAKGSTSWHDCILQLQQ